MFDMGDLNSKHCEIQQSIPIQMRRWFGSLNNRRDVIDQAQSSHTSKNAVDVTFDKLMLTGIKDFHFAPTTVLAAPNSIVSTCNTRSPMPMVLLFSSLA